MGSSFGFFTQSQNHVTFGRVRAALPAGADHPNHPDHPGSPNAPRVAKLPGYQNPILGDPGHGQIGRYQTVRVDALGVVIDQIIEQYLRDKSWYGRVRCREALWNMYRRLDWWHRNQVQQPNSEYDAALRMVKECIREILRDAQEPGATHVGVSLPLCPAPYYHRFSAAYFNHFDGRDQEIKLFSTKDMEPLPDLPGYFRYVSTTEDQEWELVHSLGGDGTSGHENILKLDLNRLSFGNSSKITFHWRFKSNGFIRFKHRASTPAGNGLLFFLNNEQVGGEWNESESWQEVKFHVRAGQTYKFEWFVRKQVEPTWGRNAVFLKDIECVELIRVIDQSPPDYDTYGDTAYQMGSDWLTHSRSSVVRAHFPRGIVDPSRSSKALEFTLDNECDGELQFAYCMGVRPPQPDSGKTVFFQDPYEDHEAQGFSEMGSSALSHYSPHWTMTPGYFASTADSVSETIYTVFPGEDTVVSATGRMEIVCPPEEEDHTAVPTTRDLPRPSFTMSGVNRWGMREEGGLYVLQIEDPIVRGVGEAEMQVYVEDHATLQFRYAHRLRKSEKFEVDVNGDAQVYNDSSDADDAEGIEAELRLVPGLNLITFRIRDWKDDLNEEDRLVLRYSYGEESQNQTFHFETEQGSTMDVRRDWAVDDSRTYTQSIPSNPYGDTSTLDPTVIEYDISLNPQASFSLDEKLKFYNSIPPSPDRQLVFAENFDRPPLPWYNLYGDIDFSKHWEWEDLTARYGSPDGETYETDGVFKIENRDNSYNTAILRDLNLDYDGKLTFRYGGAYGRREKLELYDNGKRIWSGSRNSRDAIGTSVTVPLDAGTHSLRWLYRDLSGGTPNGQGEICFPAGWELHRINYLLNEHEESSPRLFTYSFGGENFDHFRDPDGLEPVKHGTSVHKGYVMRHLFLPPTTHALYRERLKLYAGRKGDPLPHAFDIGPFFEGDGYHALDAVTVQPEDIHALPRISASFRMPQTGDLVISFDLLALLRLQEGIEANASFRAFLVDEAGDEMPYFTTFQMNVGRPQRFEAITDWSEAERVQKKMTLAEGNYTLCFELENLGHGDTQLVGGEELPYYAAFRNLTLDLYAPDTPTGLDNTMLLVEVRDSDTGGWREWAVYPNADHPLDPETGTLELTVEKGWFAPGDSEIRYTLYKGFGILGGLQNRGGSFELRDGELEEVWEAYCEPAPETCFPEGQEDHLLDYEKLRGGGRTERDFEYSWSHWKGERFHHVIDSDYGPWVQHGTVDPRGNLTRAMTIPPLVDGVYKEKLTVYAAPEYESVPIFVDPGQFRPVNGYYLLDVTQVSPGDTAPAQKVTFQARGETTITYDLLTFLKHENIVRGSFRSYLLDQDGNLVADLVNPPVVDNIGRKQRHDRITDWDDARQVGWSGDLPDGTYTLYLELKDEYSDTDGDDISTYFYAAIRDIKVVVKGERVFKGWDKTSVLFEVIDKRTRDVLKSVTYPTYDPQTGRSSPELDPVRGTCVIDIVEHWPSDGSYEFRYTLQKGAGTTGGLQNMGGGFTLTDGNFHESWKPYCSYPVDPPPAEPTWCWFDDIEIWEQPPREDFLLCPDTVVRVRLYDEDGLLHAEDYHPRPTRSQPAQDLHVSHRNETDERRNYRLSIEFSPGTCHGYGQEADQAQLTDGVFILSEPLPLPSSWARVWDWSLTEYSSGTIGGCNGATMTLKVIAFDHSGQPVDYATIPHTGSGPFNFTVTGLTNSAYSMYRFVIQTHQVTQTSSSGRVFQSTFRIRDFAVEEAWRIIPKPFSSQLKFYIDGQLRQTYSAEGGFFEQSFPVPKGRHTVRWVFTGGEPEKNYDYCELDWVRLTNWLCDQVLVIPYCDKFSGDRCIEALIKCLLNLWKNRRDHACVIGKKVWLFT